MADKEYEQSAHNSENENKDIINEQHTPENNGAFMNEGPPTDEIPDKTCEQSDEAEGNARQSDTEDAAPPPEKKWIVVYDEDGNTEPTETVSDEGEDENGGKKWIVIYDEDGNTDPEGPTEEPKAADESAINEPIETEQPEEEISEETEAEEPVEEAPAEEAAEENPEETEAEEPLEEAAIEEPAEENPEETEAEEPVEEAAFEELTEEIPEATEAEEPVEETPVEEPAEEIPEETEAEEPVEEAAIEEPTEEVPEENEAEEPLEEAAIEEPAEEIPEATEAEEPVEEAAIEEPAVEEPSEEEGFEIFFDENGEVHLKGPKTNQQADTQRKYEEPQDDEEEVDPEDLVIHDEMITAVKAEGRRLKNTEASLKSYALHSKGAIRNLTAAMKAGKRALENNRDDKEAPVILAGIIRVCGKILEVRCDNLENYVRIKAYNYIKEARTSLHEDIDEYNDLVITYSSLTGEQLTRLSTFLPENISAGKALSVVPTLTYKESYVQIFPDAEDEAGDVNNTVIEPAITAEKLLRDRKPPASKMGCSFYTLRAGRACTKLRREIARLTKLIHETKSSRKKYESELHSLESRTPLAKRATQQYKNKVFLISARYGRKLSGINTVKAASAFARTRIRLFVDRLAVERERLIVAYELLRGIYRCGSRSQRKAAERGFKSAIISYNKCAEATERVTGSSFDKIPASIIERACRGEEIIFPAVAYRRELVETVGSQSRIISMTPVEDVAPDEQTYAENADRILDKHATVKDTACLSDEAAMVDRASAIARVMLSSLRESADMVITADDLGQFRSKRDRAVKYFKRSLRATERAIAKAFDEHGVVTALVENLRVISNLIEVRRIAISVETRLGHDAEASGIGRALYKNIELYNGRAIDYMSIVGEQFSRITTLTAKELKESAQTLKVPVITYKDNYIEVFPKDPLKDSTYEKPRLWRSGVYTPLLMQHYRLTENRAVETTVVNSPFVFDVMVDDFPAVSWWHPIGFWQHLFVWAQPIVAWWHRVWTNAEIWFVDESLIFSKSGLKGRESRNGRKKGRYERKLARLNERHTAQILALETVVNDSDRHSASYQKKLYKINAKYSRKVYNLKVRWMRDCPGRNEARLLLERLVLERERLSGINKVLLKYRNYGRITFTRNVLVRYKKTFIKAITDHNATAAKLSELVGVRFAEVSTSVADEIIRYGKIIKFPEIVCCREVIETIDGKQRTVGDRWHGYGLYTGTSGAAVAANNPPVMSVGAMGYATDMGVPFLKADFDGMTMLGMTPGGVPLIGFSDNGETDIPFTGTPMMLSGQDSSTVLAAGGAGQDKLILGATNTADPYSGINTRAVDANYLDEAEEDAKDARSGCNVETPLDIETKMIEERFQRALRARSMTTVDGVKTWWRLLGSEINVRIMRWLILRPHGFLRFLLPPVDGFIESVNTRVSRKDTEDLENIAKLGGIIDIECKRFYSAVKAGIRRSQRVWSCWLHDDIERYNVLVREFNSGHERHMHLETLSLTIPDIIKNRSEDRPPAPPVLSLRNRVKLDENATPISTDKIYDRLVEFAETGATKHAGFFRRIWSRLVTVPRIRRNYQRGRKAKVLSLVSRVIKHRTARTYLRRQDNEGRHYRIRYEKARAMKRYNRRNLRAIGVAADPIKYQARAHKVLRRYLHNNFRIDYNMRIRQLVYRSLRIDTGLYVSMTIVLASILAIASIFIESSPSLRVLATIAICWTALPIVFLLLRIVYEIVMFLVSCVLLVTRNIWLIKYGARDVERNRYGAILDCFVTEQYRLLLACEKLRQKPASTSARKSLIAAVNDYNKRAEVFSEILRIPIRAIETTGLIEKLTSGEKMRLTELQNFIYIRELVERVDTHKVGKRLSDRELGYLVEEINHIINGINISGSDNDIAVDFLQGAMQRLIGYIQTDIKPSQNDRYELKRDLIQAINAFDIGYDSKERFAANVIKIVDQLGGRDRRRIIGILAKDDMIF